MNELNRQADASDAAAAARVELQRKTEAHTKAEEVHVAAAVKESA